MREIKFRAWCKEHGMSESCSIWDLQIMDAEGLTNMDEVKIMQSTGLKDKNGVDIYEGDILRWKCSKSGSNKERDYVVTIQWGRHGYDITIHNNGKWKTHNSYWNDENREVIGNIYQTPELLESED